MLACGVLREAIAEADHAARAASIVEHALERLAYYKAPGYVAFLDALPDGIAPVQAGAVEMVAGFALVAWPAEWGNTGVMTFIVNQQGIVYQKNLGPRTASIAQAMTTYDPDKTWTLVKE